MRVGKRPKTPTRPHTDKFVNSSYSVAVKVAHLRGAPTAQEAKGKANRPVPAWLTPSTAPEARQVGEVVAHEAQRQDKENAGGPQKPSGVVSTMPSQPSSPGGARRSRQEPASISPDNLAGHPLQDLKVTETPERETRRKGKKARREEAWSPEKLERTPSAGWRASSAAYQRASVSSGRLSARGRPKSAGKARPASTSPGLATPAVASGRSPRLINTPGSLPGDAHSPGGAPLPSGAEELARRPHLSSKTRDLASARYRDEVLPGQDRIDFLYESGRTRVAKCRARDGARLWELRELANAQRDLETERKQRAKSAGRQRPKSARRGTLDPAEFYQTQLAWKAGLESVRAAKKEEADRRRAYQELEACTFKPKVSARSRSIGRSHNARLGTGFASPTQSSRSKSRSVSPHATPRPGEGTPQRSGDVSARGRPSSVRGTARSHTVATVLPPRGAAAPDSPGEVSGLLLSARGGSGGGVSSRFFRPIEGADAATATSKPAGKPADAPGSHFAPLSADQIEREVRLALADIANGDIPEEDIEEIVQRAAAKPALAIGGSTMRSTPDHLLHSPVHAPPDSCRPLAAPGPADRLVASQTEGLLRSFEVAGVAVDEATVWAVADRKQATTKRFLERQRQARDAKVEHLARLTRYNGEGWDPRGTRSFNRPKLGAERGGSLRAAAEPVAALTPRAGALNDPSYVPMSVRLRGARMPATPPPAAQEA
ncbi:unnamed protein product [Pedinophyceae sp. YPF-701]|nr:unnamed protein product [Pedinophyceae sp. YPF-701]